MRRVAFLLFILCATFLPLAAKAHPHIWIDSKNEFFFNDKGEITAVSVNWGFDDLYSAFIIEPLKRDKDGNPTPAELKKVGASNIKSIESLNYFVEMTLNDKPVKVGKVTEVISKVLNDTYLLRFVLPLEKPIKLDKDDIFFFYSYDPEFYVAIELVQEKPVFLRNNPENCRHTVTRPSFAAEAGVLADEVAITNTRLAKKTALRFADKIEVTCP